MEKDQVLSSLIGVEIPVLPLDQKWHRLFALGGKPDIVKELEAKVNSLIARQGEAGIELKKLKVVKSGLMDSVMNNLEGTQEDANDSEAVQLLDENKRLLEEAKVKEKELEDELLDLPLEIADANKELLYASMEFCYDKLRKNSQEASDITEWIIKTREELKKNVIKKQNREINNKEIYAYMHDIFGKDILDIFDIHNDDFKLDISVDHVQED